VFCRRIRAVHIYTATFGVYQSVVQRSLHVGGGIVLFLLLSPQALEEENAPQRQDRRSGSTAR
jgi:hypothetical protein